MRYEWAVDIKYENGKKKRFNFFTKMSAKNFIFDMNKWKMQLGIASISNPIELYPKDGWVSPWMYDRINIYLKNLEDNN